MHFPTLSVAVLTALSLTADVACAGAATHNHLAAGRRLHPQTSPDDLAARATYTGWTSVSSSTNAKLEKVTLSEAIKATKGSTPAITASPDGTKGLTCEYQPGKLSSSNGWSYYANLGKEDGLAAAQEATLTYKVYFKEGFDWVKGGKLPGLYGGLNGDVYGCSGGEQEKRGNCFSLRHMWRTNGDAEVYTYLPLSVINLNACKASGANAECSNPTYGLSFGRGNARFTSGEWITIKQTVRLNDVGQNNGFFKMSINGKEVISSDTLKIRVHNATTFMGIMMSTFFGGSDASWVPTTKQQAWFKDFTLSWA